MIATEHIPMGKTKTAGPQEGNAMDRTPAEPVFRKEIDWESVIPKLKDYIEASKDAGEAKLALETLVKLGCDRDLILHRLHMYAGGSRADVTTLKRAFQYRRDFVSKLSNRLKNEVAPAIARANSYLDDAGIDLITTLEEDVLCYADLLDRLNKSFLSDLASKRISGRDHHLVFLAKMIEAVTGTPHYKELAVLADTVALAFDPGCKAIHTAESMRKLVKRYGPLDFESAWELQQLKTHCTHQKP
jgi:hypothetical protein